LIRLTSLKGIPLKGAAVSDHSMELRTLVFSFLFIFMLGCKKQEHLDPEESAKSYAVILSTVKNTTCSTAAEVSM
jgi:hypothetical protein